MNFIKTLILAAVLASPVIGQEIQPQADANRHYFSLFTHENWQSIPEESRLMAMLEEGSLKKLKDQCHFKHYTDSDEVSLAFEYRQLLGVEFINTGCGLSPLHIGIAA